jgi:hypothetical protein
MDGYLVRFLRFWARAAVPVPGGPSAGSRRTVREVQFIQVFFMFFASSSCFASFFGQKKFGDCPPRRREPSVRHQLLMDRLGTWRGPSIIRGALLEVRLSFSDRPSVTHGPSACTTRGPSAWSPRTICLVPRRAAKFFAS